MASTRAQRSAGRRPGTTTSNFGVGARENHDASGFYGRFRPPEVSDDDGVLPPFTVEEPFVCGDARHLDALPDGSVALVVTSPPYFAGKQYEEELEREGVPSSYLDYLQMLTEVFAECARKLEPGGRIAVNVANLGRKPYRSLSADVIRILEHDLGLLLRGELVWQKAEGASGSCAWGSFRSAANPVLRDVTERVIIASKGRFDRAQTVKQRAAAGLPHESTSSTDDFLSLTLDVWSIPPESARRVGHPAPFPVELPEQLIRLYTFAGDLVLDPFMGSGSALVAAARLGRRYIGYDLDAGYVDIARRRVEEALAASEGSEGSEGGAAGERTAPVASATHLAEERLADAGFSVVASGRTVRGTGATVDFVATDAAGAEWWFNLGGPATSRRGGLLRTEVVWRELGRACALASARRGTPLVLLSPQLPACGSSGDRALHAAGPAVLFDVVDLQSEAGLERLRGYGKGRATTTAEPGFWPASERRA